MTAVLDVGCGTGNLLVEVAAGHPGLPLTGIDPSEALLGKARARPELADAALVAGGVEAMPFVDGAFSHTLSLLVLQEFADRDGAVVEMRRVTRTGGVVAACQWDFGKMPVIAALVEAITEVDPVAGARLDRRASPVFHDEAELVDCWTRGGLGDVTATRIVVERRFAGFDEVWAPLLAGSTPSTLTLAGMPAEQRARVRELMMRRLGVVDTKAAMTLRAEALVVRGRA
jgi:SAM-dependent methyltransferase